MMMRTGATEPYVGAVELRRYNPIALEPAICPHIAAAEIDLNIDIDELANIAKP